MVRYKVQWASINDYDRIISFINEVFELDFKTMLPKYYGGISSNALKHIIAEDEKGILACVGVFPTTVDIAGTKLNGQIIGSVSVHPRARNLGLMRELMNEAMNRIDKLHADFAVLSGDRQRYEYFGFTTAGILFEFFFNKNNMRHLGVNAKISFKAMEAGAKTAKIADIHKDKLISYARPKTEIVNICKSYDNEIFSVFDGEKNIGYLLARGSAINEICLTEDKYPEVVLAFMNSKNLENIKCALTPIQIGGIKECSLKSERYIINNCCNLKVCEYAKMVEAYLNAKNKITPLISGKAVIQIVNKGKYLISVSGDSISVKETTRKANLVLTEFEATQKMFASAGFLQEDDLTKNWFPLPFFIERADNG